MDLSAVSRINETQISKIETGDYGPNLQTIRALAVALGVRPSELLNFDFDLKLNTNFTIRSKKRKKSGATGIVNRLVSDNYFKSARSVSDIVAFCKKELNISLSSADTSGVLLRLVKNKILKRVPSQGKGKYLYQKAS